MSWQTFFPLDRSAEYQVLEYYAGIGRIARLSAASGYRAAAFDIGYDSLEVVESWPGSPTTKAKILTTVSGKKASMDLTKSSGFMFLGSTPNEDMLWHVNLTSTCLSNVTFVGDSCKHVQSSRVNLSIRCALAMAMQGKLDECVSFWGICCSSWIHMNSGTSNRDYLTPMGCEAFQSVQSANLMVSRLGCKELVGAFSWPHSIASSLSESAHPKLERRRSMLLILLCICMGGTPCIENPGSSMVWMHDRFQWLLGVLELCKIKEPQLIFDVNVL